MKTLRTGVRAAAVLVAALTCAAPAPSATAEDGWLPTGEGITHGLSGLAVAGATGDEADVLAVHDNKRTGEARVSRIRFAPGGPARAEERQWVGERLPVDLEALAEVPGRPGEFVAFESSGRGFHIRLEGASVRALREFTVPGVADGAHAENYEGFALVRRAGALAALWAHRGRDQEPAVVHLARLDWATLSFGPRTSHTVRVPYPGADVRHISDLEVSPAGEVLTSAASDPGDDGPFDSAVYAVGRVTGGLFLGPGFAPYPGPVLLEVFTGHKIEALACRGGVPDTVLGSDDENQGGSVRPAAFCANGR
ncbi:hypothetical protein [Streptomyces yaizuensis]|uniref:Esterase-like activity of phytase family protein n=1 Tax=Streptomyces yaizuensis TaxID=2989713 RepID=A0ABQ5NSQ1_9ACTN|nr:hypothetical protein [Streptomyces sp. YSPA8]GLF93394.1 esterase-like activity of phytase family protein [Streptomyces sp. YSPA8]